MGIFSRGNKDGRGTKDTGAEPDPSITVASGDESSGSDTTATTTAPTGQATRRGGPFDRSEVEGLEGRLDLGALWLTGVPGMELQLEVEEESQNVVGVTAALGDSSVQLQAFAAPRSEGIWDDIRKEIAASITSQGGTADSTSGPLGPELRAQMPTQGPDGRTVFAPVRFVGVDGPRWFLRAVLNGPAALDEGDASSLLDVVRATVVVRGEEAMAPRELLSLKLPAQPEGQDVTDGTPAEGDPGDQESPDENAARRARSSVDDFKPFERGPEITEIH